MSLITDRYTKSLVMGYSVQAIQTPSLKPFRVVVVTARAEVPLGVGDWTLAL